MEKELLTYCRQRSRQWETAKLRRHPTTDEHL